MMPLIPLADVTVFGALGPEGEEFKNVRVTMIGNPTSAVFSSASSGRTAGIRWID
jgi:hypothetical protein